MPAIPRFTNAETQLSLAALDGVGPRSDAESHATFLGSKDEPPPSTERAKGESRAAVAAAAVAAASGHTPEPIAHESGLAAGSEHKSYRDQAAGPSSQLPEPDVDAERASPVRASHSGVGANNGGSSRRNYDCHICGWRFALKGNLVAHMRRHTGEKPYVCSICDRKFTQSSLLTVHMRTHTGEKPFKCQKCGRSFSRSGNLTTHMRTHNATKPYECAFCHKTFSQRVNMELHTRVHTGVKPYRCGVCNRAFTSCSNMRRHWRHVHPSYPEPAMGTLHLLHGMPEKALYPAASRPTNYRPQGDRFTGEAPVEGHAAASLSAREELPPLLQPGTSEPIYAHMLGAHTLNSMGGHLTHHNINSLNGALPGHVSANTGPQLPAVAHHDHLSHELIDSGGQLNPTMGPHMDRHKDHVNVQLVGQLGEHFEAPSAHRHQPHLGNHMVVQLNHLHHHGHHHPAHQSPDPVVARPRQALGGGPVASQFVVDRGLGAQPRFGPTPHPSVTGMSLESAEDLDPAIKDAGGRMRAAAAADR